ncbi:hypothetical protein E3N88_06906 [Mikania micrantha]|uniref:Protein FAR1-RELATED SEQUENCE n=1 Tax=Mikania micrantha TaxID=192012 RepID=A0A5N6PSF4_9ASTR|nr:hypothetical protein E3N88_06906 [Mikania micrantha]
MLTDAKQYRIYAFEEGHNHDFVDKEDYHLLHASRKLSVVQEQLISDLSMMNIGPVKAFNIMRVRYGGFEDVGVTAMDCKNFRRDLNTFIGEYDCDMAVKHLLSKKEDQLKDMISKVDSSFVEKKALRKNDRFSNIVHEDPPSFATIKRSIGIRTKGSGSQKRLKSYRELASVQKEKKGRACVICKRRGHNKRSCPTTRDVADVNQNTTKEHLETSQIL